MVFFLVALSGPDLVSGAFPHLIEGHDTFAFRLIQSHLSDQPHRLAGMAFTQYWGMLTGIGDTVRRYD